MTDSVQKLKKKIWKISENEAFRPSYKSSDHSKVAAGREDMSLPKKNSLGTIQKKLAASDVPMSKLSKNKSMHFDSNKE